MSYILLACFIVIPAVFFIVGTRGILWGEPRATPTPMPEDISATDTPSPTPSAPDPTPTPTMAPPVKVQGIYFTLTHTGNNALEHCIQLTETTNLNAIVIDLKDDRGQFTFATENEVLKPASEAFFNFYNYTMNPILKQDIDDMNERGVYTIARIVCFRDNVYAQENPSAALQNINGGAWREGSDGTGSRWLDPYNRDNWEYIAAICREAAELGFDEVQLDYVRFPTDGKTWEINYGEAADEEKRYEIINDFVKYIREEMISYGVRTSADVFAIVGMSYRDASSVGQNFQLLLGSLDSICPMVYPSHFANSSPVGYAMANGVGQYIGPSYNIVLYERPNLQPYEVVHNYLLQIKESQVEVFQENHPDVEMAAMRPYLQYFSPTYLPESNMMDYGPEEVKLQIQATFDAGFEEYILWRSYDNDYLAEAIP